MSISATVLASRCRPNAFSLNFILVLSTNGRAIEVCGIGGVIRSRHGDAAPAPLCGCRGRASMMPHAKSPKEREVIAAEARVFRQALQLARIATADDDIVGF